MTKASQTAQCPECGADVAVPADSVSGEIVSCGECGVDLEITEGNPVTLVLAPEEEEDWGE